MNTPDQINQLALRRPLDRRTALKGALVMLGGFLGLGTISNAARASELPPRDGLRLNGRGWHITSRDLPRGALPTAGDRMLVHGELLDGPEGTRVGHFYATYFGLYSPGQTEPLTSLEQHTFLLPGGSIMGAGSTGPGLESTDEFAIVGGTGIYSGAKGSYVARQSHIELGGDGTASFEFSLTVEGPRNG